MDIRFGIWLFNLWFQSTGTGGLWRLHNPLPEKGTSLPDSDMGENNNPVVLHPHHKLFSGAARNQTARVLVMISQAVHEVALIIPHEDYDPTTTNNDIALIRLRTPIQYTVAVQPVCLPRSAETENTLCIISGWGDTRGTNTCHRYPVLSKLALVRKSSFPEHFHFWFWLSVFPVFDAEMCFFPIRFVTQHLAFLGKAANLNETTRSELNSIHVLKSPVHYHFQNEQVSFSPV